MTALPTGTDIGISAALAQAQTTQNRKAEAEKLDQEGLQQYQRGGFQEALQSFQQALQIYREIGDKVGEGKSLNNIGQIHSRFGKYSKAIEFYQQYLVIAREFRKRWEKGLLSTVLVKFNAIGVSILNHLSSFSKQA